jgi:hypothetical protein
LLATRCGVRLDPDDHGVAEAVIATLPPAVNLAILVPTDHDLVHRHVELLRAGASSCGSKRQALRRHGWPRPHSVFENPS